MSVSAFLINPAIVDSFSLILALRSCTIFFFTSRFALLVVFDPDDPSSFAASSFLGIISSSPEADVHGDTFLGLDPGFDSFNSVFLTFDVISISLLGVFWGLLCFGIGDGNPGSPGTDGCFLFVTILP
jgi:hypothetical protein